MLQQRHIYHHPLLTITSKNNSVKNRSGANGGITKVVFGILQTVTLQYRTEMTLIASTWLFWFYYTEPLDN